jgi:hypothetical protein
MTIFLIKCLTEGVCQKFTIIHEISGLMRKMFHIINFGDQIIKMLVNSIPNLFQFVIMSTFSNLIFKI